MKISKYVIIETRSDGWCVSFAVPPQYFTFVRGLDTETEARWFKKMFVTALRRMVRRETEGT